MRIKKVVVVIRVGKGAHLFRDQARCDFSKTEVLTGRNVYDEHVGGEEFATDRGLFSGLSRELGVTMIVIGEVWRLL